MQENKDTFFYHRGRKDEKFFQGACRFKNHLAYDVIYLKKFVISTIVQLKKYT